MATKESMRPPQEKSAKMKDIWDIYKKNSKSWETTRDLEFFIA